MKPRPYQEDAIRSMWSGFEHHRSVLIVMATGLGKTVLFSTACERWTAGRVLVLAHREELIDQAFNKLKAILTGSKSVGIEMGQEFQIDPNAVPDVVVSSVQTMSRPRRLQKFDPRAFGLVVIDEAHHAVASTYKRVIDYFFENPDCKLLGVTATPKRSDELAMGQVFESCPYQYGIEDAIPDGWLVSVRQQIVQVDGLDFSNLDTVAGDFNQGQLEQILTEEAPLHRVASAGLEIVGNRQTLVFTVSVSHAEKMAEVINRYRPGQAKFLSGDSSKEERRRWIQAYKGREIQFLVNCSLFLEGFDAPSTSAILMCRPTKSVSLYTQVLGRGTRTYPEGLVDRLAEASPEERRLAIAQSVKPEMLMVDFTGKAGRHKIVNAVDVLGGKFDDPVRQIVRKHVEESGKAMIDADILETASLWNELLKEESVRSKDRIKARSVQYRVEEVDPLGGSGMRTSNDTGTRTEQATAKQIWKLTQLGVQRSTAASYTKRQASAVIDKLVKRREELSPS